jgi:hypothetical protein
MKIFKEEQRFTQPLIYIGLSIAAIVVFTPIIKDWSAIVQLPLNKQLRTFVGIIVICLVAVLFLFLKLRTRIDEKGISFKFTPFHFKSILINWKEVNKAYLRKYNAISEYGGWGIKGGIPWVKGNGRAYNVKGNIGLQLELKNGNRILIGTQKKEDIERVLNNYKSSTTANEN